MTGWYKVVLVVLLFAACGESTFTREQLLQPETCEGCHPQHYLEWSGSMHAYAADDPVFLAMNERGQEETDGMLGDFCVNCHAPIAVSEGLTSDGLNMDSVPQYAKGVTCYFCHNVEDVLGDHNNPLVLADDTTMRGGIADPVGNEAHRSVYSPLHDRNSEASSALCGACHDIVTPAGVHLERTFQEWQDSVFGMGSPQSRLSCSQCHMKGDVPGVVADVPGVPSRFPHEHSWPGVDVALTAWPQKQQQLELIARELFGAIGPTLCVEPVPGGVDLVYVLDNVFGGHMLPSGAAHDRRLWAEVTAYTGDTVVYQSGLVAADQAVTDVEAGDPDFWLLRDRGFDGDGAKTNLFWDIRSVESELLPPAVTNDPDDPNFFHAVEHRYPFLGATPDRVTAVVHMRPMGLDVIDDLIASGHLDPSTRDETVTFTLSGTSLEWTSAVGFGCVTP